MKEEFYANGKLMARGVVRIFPDGRVVKIGVWTNFWASGAICTFGAYEDDEKVGDWPFVTEDGATWITNRNRAPTLGATP